MSYHVTHPNGAMEPNFPVERFGELFDELLQADIEHPDIAVTHQSEWALVVNRSNMVVLEHLEEGDPRHVGPLDRSICIKLMEALAEGRIQDIRAELDWREGYPE